MNTRRVFLGLILACGFLSWRVEAAPRVEIVPLPAVIPADMPVIPWVKAGDTAWQSGPPVFDVANENSGLKAQGWLAVQAEAILFHVVVHDKVHFNESPDQLHAGDSLQLGIDALGASADQPPVIDIDGEVEKLYGQNYHPDPEKSKAAIEGEIKAFRQTLEKMQKNQEAWPNCLLLLTKHDADYCVALCKGAPMACSYYHGQGAAGVKTNLNLHIVRDETAQTTTYDFAIPWSDLGAVAGIAPTIKMSLFVNDVNAAKHKIQKTFWGGGIGGSFLTYRFNRLAIGEPAEPFSTVMVTRETIAGPANDAQAVIAVKNAAPLRIEASFDGQSAALDIPPAPGPAALRRYAVRANGLTQGSAVLQAKLLAGGKTLAEVSQRIFNGSTDRWYEFKPANDFAPGQIGLQDWSEKPAGKHGFLHIRDGRMVADDGTLFRFLGSNANFPPNGNDAETFATFLEKYGVTATQVAVLGEFGSTNATSEFDPVKLDKYDKVIAALRNHGLYYPAGLQWGYHVQPGDAPKLMAYQEALKAGTLGLENFAPDIQDLRIEAAVNFFKHKNPYTGLTYAEDPALYGMEIQNEDDIFWYTTGSALGKCPTYRAFFCKQFCDWLRARYSTQEKLLAAWGDRALNAFPPKNMNESLENNNIYPTPDAWYFGLFKQMEQRGLGKRLLDTAEFLHETQNKYYQRFEKAVRAVGFKGILLGSNWQADSGISHYYNLLSDRLVGGINRHNYWGGMGTWFIHPGLLQGAGDSMLDSPGRGLLSTGLQQVSDRPFTMGEWMVDAPCPWQVEGPILMAAYGLGLQGWSAVYDTGFLTVGFTPTIDVRGNVFNGCTPAQLTLYPALARMVMRGDVKQGAVISTRRVSLEDLKTGKLNFNETVTQNGDVKDITGDAPAAALAAGRMLVEFVDKSTPSTFPDIKQALQDKVIVSNTGQLTWYFPGREQGHFTINTDGTKALVGFLPNREFALGDVKLQMDTKYGALFVTALEKDKTLANCQSALVTAVARARNTGMVYGDCSLDRLGRAPVIMEPVFGFVAVPRPIAKVYLLDHDGKRTDKTVPVQNGKLILDGSHDQTPYYEVIFE